MKILLAAYYKPGIKAIEYLLNNGFKKDQIRVLTHISEQNKELLAFAKKNEVDVNTNSIKEIKTQKWIKDFNPDILFSLYFRDIIPSNILKIPEYGCINLHPSLLPKYKGCFSTPWAIINGEEYTGFTYHFMTENIDAGNIIYFERVRIENEDTAYSLYHKLIELGMSSFPTVLDLVLKKDSGVPQIGSDSYYPRKVPFDGFINPNWDKEKIRRFIHAMYFPPYPGAALKTDGEIIHIYSIEQYEQILIEGEGKVE